MIKDIFKRTKPDPKNQSLKLDGVAGEAIYLAADKITRSRELCPKHMYEKSGHFNLSWFYKMTAAEQRQKLGEYFERLAREDYKRSFSDVSYNSTCNDYKAVQRSLKRRAAKKDRPVEP